MAGAEDSRKARALARSRMIVASLARAGDDGRDARIVSHYITPASDARDVADDARIAELAKGWGLEVDFDATGQGLRLHHDTAPADPAFESLVGRMAEELDGAGWVYEGWECPVVRPAKSKRPD